MAHKTTVKSVTRKKTRQTPAEALYGEKWVRRQWRAARGLLKGRGPKDPVGWQRRLRKEWE